MHIRRKFYDEAKADLEQSEQRPLKAELTQQQSDSLDGMIQRFEQSYKKAPNPGKRAAFEALARRALDLAEFLCANISVTTENGQGNIALESDMLILDRREREYTQTVADLFTAADDIIFYVPANALPKIVFNFFLYDLAER